VLVPSIALAWALHAFVERPIEKRLRRWKDGRDQRRSGAMQVADDRGTADSRPEPKDR
jgi:peptidoglycan/LPS O-acetylase OafA/YrhL